MHVSETSTRPANRLAREKSPYLLQHQHNPVDWYAWREEAFERARQENKPILLSIGYSTCHWCHVMERESFEDEQIGEFLSRNFVSIKVDREERPDVDKIYMTFVQATTGQGGWPLNVFLTPDLKPFFGGTYFPPDSRYGRPGFLALLKQIDEVWRTRQSEVTQSANDVHAKLQQWTAQEREESPEALKADLLARAAGQLKQNFDPHNGGFGTAPKFPQPSHPRMLLRGALRFNDADALRMVESTCDHMAAGGIYDQLGGGFSRYSVDAEWLVPHFEKMLYDNAQLVQLYLDTYLATGHPRHAAVARGVLQYVLRDMTHPEGGFYSAEDADSEGHEGKFYCWTRAELAELLAPEELQAAVKYFGITEQGNFVDHSHPQPLQNQNVLSIAQPNLSDRELTALHSAKVKMSEARSKRVRPHLDDKVLASWNGLMLGAMARAAAVLGDEKYLAAAVANAGFIRKYLWDESSRTLFHRWRDGERDDVQLLEGYAAMLDGLITLYEAGLDTAHLQWAITLAEVMLERFYDAENGGFWQSGPGASGLILRVKEDYDGAEPSGNSVGTLALLRLGKMTGRQEFSKAAQRTLELFSGRMEETAQAIPYMLKALDFSLQEPHSAVIAGDPALKETKTLLQAVHSAYQPNLVIMRNTGPVEFFASTIPNSEIPVVYLCKGTHCEAPMAAADQVRNALRVKIG